MTGQADPVPAVFFLSDFGTSDEFVGVVHAVLHRTAPLVPVIDLGHRVPAFDVAAGAALLVRAGPYLGPGVVMAVVDPGVGTSRRAIAIQTVGAREAGGPTWLVGPDNGLLVPLAEGYGGVDSVIDIDRASPVFPVGTERTGPTFDGRDVFAPAAAHLVLGGDQAALGPPADPDSLVLLDVGPGEDVRRTDQGATVIVTSVASFDRFGNVQLEAHGAAATSPELGIGAALLVTVETWPIDRQQESRDHWDKVVGRTFAARRVTAFAQLEEGELGLLVDAAGHLALVLDRAPASRYLDPVEAGSRIRIAPQVRAG
jgi:S-adenosylmethionine hydrolase